MALASKPAMRLKMDFQSILRQSYETRKALISGTSWEVLKLTLCGTLGAFPDFDDWALTAESAD
jgi:hypothetical protein